MGNNKDKVNGTVLKKHPGHFDVKLDNGDTIKAYPSGKIRMNNIRILEGDEVEVVVSEYGDNGRITYRK